MKYPAEFTSEVSGHSRRVGLETPVDPYERSSHDIVTFGQLNPDAEGLKRFQVGLSSWGLAHMWNSAEIKNAFNCVEMEHSMPFYRLARFGFVAVPTPKDLGSILNANALYTFCSGVFQLAIGTLVLNLTGQWDLGFLMPLAVSSVSMMLTLANIFLDFSAILVQLEGEQRL